MATPAFVEITVGDSSSPKQRTGLIKFRVADQVFPATLQTDLTAFIATLFGAAKPSLGALLGARLIIESGDAPTAVVDQCDIRNFWRVNGQDAGLEPTRFQVPARNPSNALIAAGSVVLADESITAWTDFITALNTLAWKNPKDGDAVTVGIIDAEVRPRVRPRIGSVR